MNNTQTNLFDFLDNTYQSTSIMELDTLLSKMKELINKGVMKQTNKYFRLCLSYKPHIVKADYCDTYMVMALAWSDSAIYNDVYENNGHSLSTEEYLNTCDSLGAYTKRAWEIYFENNSIKPSDFMELFKIKEHLRPIGFANGSKEDCEEALNILIDWNTHYIKPTSELQEDSQFNFIREHKRKGEIESTRCMRGECIGGILTRENAF